MAEEKRREIIGCYICGTKEQIPFKCKYCEEYFCSNHRIPINHSCPFVNVYKKKRQDMLHDSQRAKSNVSFSQILNALHIKTSKTELLHLTIATILVTAVGLSLNGYRYFSWQFLAIFISAFLVHELAHKFLAQYYGSWAEFRAHMYGLIITALSALPIPFKFIAPGAVMVRLSDRNKFGRVALIGPVTNLVMGFSFLLMSLFYSAYSPYFATGATFNGWIAMFNLMPFGVLDGQKIFEWNKLVWVITMAAAMALFVVAYL